MLVTVTLSDGTTGIGEAAPFPAVNGETQGAVLGALAARGASFAGLDALRWRPAVGIAEHALRGTPSALAAFESALFDALCRRSRISLWSFFGGAQTRAGQRHHHPHRLRRARARRRRARRQRRLHDAQGESRRRCLRSRPRAPGRDRRLRRPSAQLVLDANASLSAAEALALLDALGHDKGQVALFEQPTGKLDLDGLRQVREHGGVPVAADESACSAADVLTLIAGPRRRRDQHQDHEVRHRRGHGHDRRRSRAQGSA